MATLTQNELAPMFYDGWYGTCPENESDNCEDFPLVSGTGSQSARIYDQIQSVFIISENGQGTLVYDGYQNLPFLISFMPVKKLECGKSYRIILKPGTGAIEIPEFTFANAGTEDKYRLTESCSFPPTPTPTDTPTNTPTPIPEYSLSASAESVNEGQEFTITLQTENIPEGTIVNYAVSHPDDFIGINLLGEFKVYKMEVPH